MKATIAVAVTVKIDAMGDTPDALISDATSKAMGVVEHGLAMVSYGDHNDRYEYSRDHPGLTISVEGATAMVNTEAIEALFKEGGE